MPVANTQPAITAIVICRNAADQLDQCLRTLRWVDELLVVNIQSTDNTLEIASRWADRILSHGSDASIDTVRSHAIDLARHDWVMIAQPTDRVSETFAHDLRTLLGFEQSTAMLKIPRRFHVRQKPLDTLPARLRHQTWLPVFCPDRCEVKTQPVDFVEAQDGFKVQDWPKKLVIPVRCEYQRSMAHWWTCITQQACARHQANERFSPSDVTVIPLLKFADVIGHFWQLRRSVRELGDILFDLLVSVKVLRYQLRRTPRLDTSSPKDSKTAHRKAA